MNVSVREAASTHGETSAVSPLRLYQQPRAFNPGDLRALIQDFFSWIEYEWRQPVLRNNVAPLSALIEQVASINIPLDEQREYTSRDLATLSGYKREKATCYVRRRRTPVIDRVPRRGKQGLGPAIYLGRDLAPIVEEWEWDEICAVIDTFWARFVKEPCGECHQCLRSTSKAGFDCKKNNIDDTRFAYTGAVSITFCEHSESMKISNPGGIMSVRQYSNAGKRPLLNRRNLSFSMCWIGICSISLLTTCSVFPLRA